MATSAKLSFSESTHPTDGVVHVLGVRHHGPGSARSLVHALASIEPTVVLIEGPPEANDLIPLVGSSEMVPPVAILVYRPDQPEDAVYYPFAEFSPEWQALRYAIDHGIPARFIDLPVAHHFAAEEAERRVADKAAIDGEPELAEEYRGDSVPIPPRRRSDPLDLLAIAAGFDDGERWWDFVVESRRHGNGRDEATGESEGVGMFRAILGAMTEVRASEPEVVDVRELRREAQMRQAIRAAEKEGHERIAVVCGAWHAPVLVPASWPPSRLDAAYLKGLPKTKVAATWVPWTYGRLSRESGYGAGIVSPGWYHHLWTTRDGVVERWLTVVARLLRDERLDASSAAVIEAVRLADALATIRGRPLADLSDLLEATRSVLCFGEDAPIRLIERKLIVGERLGRVPDETPAIPLQQDLNRLQKRLRLPSEAGAVTKVFDLRNATDSERSRLLHRLNLLGVEWGRLAQASGRGTFKEGWVLHWSPELSVAIIEASIWGTTVDSAAEARVADRVEHEAKLAGLTALLDSAILADLPASVSAIMGRVESMAAVVADVADLMAALPPLAHLTRYGSVRRTDASAVEHAASGMVKRICVGLPLACHSLDDPAAMAMFAAILQADSAIGIMALADDLGLWHAALARLADSGKIHALVTGRAARILFDAGVSDADQTARRMNLAVSPASDPALASSWVEGFLVGSGEILVHDDALFAIFDAWLGAIATDAFPMILPLIRRTFASFESPMRRALGDRAGRVGPSPRGLTGSSRSTGANLDTGIDLDRASAVLPIVALLLGLDLSQPVEGGTQP